jgi:hypothetical protein
MRNVYSRLTDDNRRVKPQEAAVAIYNLPQASPLREAEYQNCNSIKLHASQSRRRVGEAADIYLKILRRCASGL